MILITAEYTNTEYKGVVGGDERRLRSSTLILGAVSSAGWCVILNTMVMNEGG